MLPLKEYGLPIADYKIVHSAEKVNYPLVIKVAGVGSLHKTDVGGVILDIQNGDEIVQAINKIRSALISHGISGKQKYLVQKMLTGGKEIIIGGKQDPAFGPVVLCGLGGIYAEVLKDANLRLAPVFLEEAKEMLLTLKGFKSGFPVLSIYGERDGLATPEKIQASNPLLPKDTMWVEIKGGNHAQFGSYGPQNGDFDTTISAENQHQQIVDATLIFLAGMR